MKPLPFLALLGSAALAFSQYGIPIGWRTILLVVGAAITFVSGIAAGIEIQKEYPSD